MKSKHENLSFCNSQKILNGGKRGHCIACSHLITVNWGSL